MTTQELLSRLLELDIKLWVDGERLRYNAPQGAMTPELQAELLKHKAEIISRLQSSGGLDSSFMLPAERPAQIPLSFSQQRLWFVDQLEPGSAAYNMFSAVRLHGLLDVSALEQGYKQIIQRHEVLRTTFQATDGQPHQIIVPNLAVDLPVIDLSTLSQVAQETEIERLVKEEAQRPFDLAKGPLVRCSLLRQADDEHTLLLTMHHIVSDGWSMGILFREIVLLGQSFAAGLPDPLPALPLQYADFSIWQRSWLQGEVLETQMRYWKKQLAGAPATLELPTDHARPAVQTYRGARIAMTLPQGLSDALQALSQREDATLFMTLLAAFQVLLSRYSRQTDIVVGSPVANRSRTELEVLIGFFVNTLALRTDLSGNPSFRELLRRVREACLGAYDYQDVPFEKLVDELNVARDLSRNPLFQAMFVLQNAPLGSVDLGGLSMQPLDIRQETAQFDLSMSLQETPEGITGFIEYSTDLFEAATIARMAGHFQTLLQTIVANPEQHISEFPILTETEQQKIVMEWNATEAAYPQEKCLHELFEAQMEKTPEAIALVFEDQQLTYRELNQRANQLAHFLQTKGVGPDVLVGICVERSLEMLVGLLGILKAGGAYVPLDPSYPSDRLAYMLTDAGVSILLTQERLRDTLPEHSAQVICLDRDWETLIAGHSTINCVSAIVPANLAYMIYTSGSTGKPKGAMNAHLGICNRLLWMQEAYGLTEADRILQKTPFSFDVSVWEFFWPLITGARLVMAQPEGHKDSAYLVRLITEEQITTLHFVPSMLRVFLEEPGLENCASLRRVICSGEALPYEFQEKFFARLSTAELHNLYGPTEAAVDVTYWVCVRDGQQQIVPIGRPIANTQIRILDESLQPVPIGVPGELYIGGVGVGRGYHQRPELTAEKFIPDPFTPLTSLHSGLQNGGRLYKTGDLARWLPDGSIEYLGRLDFQVKLRGFRIELGEIESALSQHSAVQQVVVIIREDLPGDQRLVAYLVLRPETEPTPGALQSTLKARLPDYMLPSTFVFLDRLPITPNGKLDRKALPAPDREQHALADSYVAPRTLAEESLANIWAKVLGLKRVGIHDNFFELGGHSLLATQVVSRMRQTFNIDFPLRTMFQLPTVAELAEWVETAQGQKTTQVLPLIPTSRNGPLPLSFGQQRLWFLYQLEPGNTAYNMFSAVHVSGDLDVTALEQGFNEVVRRHEALRTTFTTIEGQPRQIIAASAQANLPVVDLSTLPQGDRELEAQRLAREEAQRPFDLSSGPLVRCSLLRLGEREHILLLNMHHIISDGWSLTVLFREIVELSQSFAAGQPSPYPDLSIQYADYAIWQREWLQGEVLAAQLGYWKEQLRGAPALLKLSTDRSRPALQTYRGSAQTFSLSTELTQALRALSQQEGATLFMTLLAAFQVLLARYSGQTDIVVGSPIANRNRAEVENLIGLFINTLVLRADLSGNPSFREALQRVREMTLGAYDHQDLPFEKLVEELRPERDLSYNPLFQVMFILQNQQGAELEVPGLTLTAVETDEGRSQFDLRLSMREIPQGLLGHLEYNTDLFDATTITRMLTHYQILLGAIAAQPETRLGNLPLLPESERRQLLEEWNDTAKTVSEVYMPRLFEQHVAERAADVAAVFEETQLTYAELNRRVNRLAHYLRSLGVGPDVLVGVYVERSLEMLVGLLGILKAGGAYVPLDPTYPQERLAYMLADARPHMILTQARLADKLPQTDSQLVRLDTDWDKVECEKDANPETLVSGENLAYVIYTSGSTGKPKGVQLSHRALMNFLETMKEQPGFTAEDTLLSVTTISFDIAGLELYLPLCSGGKVIIANQETVKDGVLLAKMLAEANVTLMQATPATWRLMLDSGWQGKPDLRILCGGEAFPEDMAREMLNKTGAVWNMYGPTETTVWSTLAPVKDVPVTLGRPVANTRIYILDRDGNPVPVGVAGEIHIGGIGLARGYRDRPELTAERFIPDALSGEAGERLYRTGDLGRYLADGRLEFLGRIDTQVKVRGYRIELGEIETVLRGQQGVKEAVVITWQESPEDEARLVAYVITEDGAEDNAKELLNGLKAQLPAYMLPSIFTFLKQFPLTPNGKIDRKALPHPTNERASQALPYTAPTTPVEEQLATIWKEVLKIEKVGIHENFFEAGGTSIMATQVISRVRSEFHVEIPLARIFEASTIAEYAELIMQARFEQVGADTLAQLLAGLE